MGLTQDARLPQSGANITDFVLPAVVLLISIVLGLFGDAGRSALRYERFAIQDGEAWRLLSGHFVHLGWSHTAMNGIGLLLVWALVHGSFSIGRWLAVVLLVIAGIDLGFWILQPHLVWYVGMSGLLHGLLTAGAVDGMRKRQLEFWVLSALLAGKLVYEQVLGPLPGSASTAGGNVIVAAHLYGAIGGVIAGLMFSFRKSTAAPL